MELVQRRQQRIDDLQHRLLHAEREVLERCRRQFETLAGAVRHYDARRILSGIAKELAAREAAMAAAIRAAVLQQRSRLEQLSGADRCALAAGHSGAGVCPGVRRCGKIAQGRGASQTGR